MPTFCRHNRLVQNCPICSREQQIELRAVVSPSTPTSSRDAGSGHAPRPPRAKRERTAPSGGGAARGARGAGGAGGARGRGVVVRRMARGADDGFASPLVPGLHSSADAGRLADEIAFAAGRLTRLEAEPPGLYAEVAGGADPEESAWLAFLIALVGPGDANEPFASLADPARRPSWRSGVDPELDGVVAGPRGALQTADPLRMIRAYRAWVGRSGSQQAAFGGDASWTAERRFARIFERLALPGLHRGARFELLVTLGRLGVMQMRAATLFFGGTDPVTLAAKRALGIGDPLLLDRRAAALAAAAGVDLEALDLGFFNWERGSRHGGGLPEGSEPALPSGVRDALGL